MKFKCSLGYNVLCHLIMRGSILSAKRTASVHVSCCSFVGLLLSPSFREVVAALGAIRRNSVRSCRDPGLVDGLVVTVPGSSTRTVA